MLVSSPPFHGGEPGAAPGSPTKTFWAVSSVGKTLVSASTVEKKVASELKKTNDIDAAAYVGKVIAERAKAAGIEEVVFDRGGCIDTGKIKALADAAREAGLVF